MTQVARPRILVTGASRRVGRAIAMQLAHRDVDLLVSWNTDEEGIRETVDLVTGMGQGRIDVIVERLDLSDPSDIRGFVDRIDGIQIDGIVHNASLYEPSTLESFDPDLASRHAMINSIAPVSLTSMLAGCLDRSRLESGGSVVCMGDANVGDSARRSHVCYMMSKAALHEAVRIMSRSLAPGVRVNGVAPGVVAWPEDTTEQFRQQYLKRVPMERVGTESEAASAACWLLLDATYVTGVMLPVDGGRSLH